MGISCCAGDVLTGEGCKPNWAFYHIPADDDKRRQWITAINPKDWQPSKYLRMGSHHFFTGWVDHCSYSFIIIIKLLYNALCKNIGRNVEKEQFFKLTL